MKKTNTTFNTKTHTNDTALMLEKNPVLDFEASVVDNNKQELLQQEKTNVEQLQGKTKPLKLPSI